MADAIGCVAATIGNARNRNGKLSAHTLFNLLSVDPLALESLLAHFDRRSVPITAKCDTDALPSTAGAVHKLAVVTSEASPGGKQITDRSEEQTSELQSLMRTSYAVFCLKKITQKH